MHDPMSAKVTKITMVTKSNLREVFVAFVVSRGRDWRRESNAGAAGAAQWLRVGVSRSPAEP